jgi:hypothetical protein
LTVLGLLLDVVAVGCDGRARRDPLILRALGGIGTFRAAIRPID